MSYRTHPLYRLACHVSRQPIAWDNPDLARLQYEMRVDFTERTDTLSLIGMTAGRCTEDAQALARTLGEIFLQPEQFDYDAALGQGRN